MRRVRWWPAAMAAVVLVGVTVACGSEDSNVDSAADLASAPIERQVTVEMRDLAFEPQSISIRADEVIEMTFHNNGAVVHDFTIDQMDADVKEMMAGGGMATGGHTSGNDMPRAMHMAVSMGQEGVMRLRVREPGEYQYYCTVPGHREAGMSGTLTVE